MSTYAPTAPMIRFTLMRPSRIARTSSSTAKMRHAHSAHTKPSIVSQRFSTNCSRPRRVNVSSRNRMKARMSGLGSNTKYAPNARPSTNVRSSHRRDAAPTSTMG